MSIRRTTTTVRTGFPSVPSKHLQCKPFYNLKLLQDLFRAYYDARKYTRGKATQIKFEMHLEDEIVRLYEEIRDRTYEPSPAICFVVRKPVNREVFSSEFRDRVVHHLLFNYLSPVADRYMIYDCYSCRKGKGTSEGIRRCEHHIRSCTHNYTRRAYILKLDIRGYFMSIDKSHLMSIIMRIMDKNSNWEGLDKDLVMFLLRKVVFRNVVEGCVKHGPPSDFNLVPPQKSLFGSKEGVGLPIGDLTSQLFSNIYLYEFDQFVKRTLKCRHYGRYVDDFYLVHEDREYLVKAVDAIKVFLWEELHLTLHPNKIIIQDCRYGLNYLGAYICPFRTYVSSRTVSFFRSACRKAEYLCSRGSPTMEEDCFILSMLNSYLGHMTQYKSYKQRAFIKCCRHLRYRFDTNPSLTRIQKDLIGKMWLT